MLGLCRLRSTERIIRESGPPGRCFVNPDRQAITRRDFLRKGASATATLGLVGASIQGLQQAFGAQSRPNPFAYNVERFARTDPKLIQYEQTARFPSLAPEPRRIAIGPDGRLFIAGRNGITVLNSTGERAQEIALAAPGRCVAVAKNGTVYAGLRDHVESFDAKGQRIASWEPVGKRSWLTGMAANSEGLFVADAGNRMILHYDGSGKIVERIGEKNKEHNVPGLIVPSPYLDVDVGADGLLRVNNPGRHCVETYTTHGELELSWGKPSARIDGFCGCCNPIALTVLPDGGCVSCEKGLPRVKVYSAQGAFECVVAGPETFPENAKAGSVHDRSDGTMGGLDAAVDSQGRIYILDLVAGDVRVMKRKDNAPGKA